MEEVFTNVYETFQWGNNRNKDYNGSSGAGSAVSYNKDTYIPFLKNFIIEKGIKEVVDLGCGDFRCGRLIYDDLDVHYTGYDAYKKVIEHNTKEHPDYTFHHLDICGKKEQIKGGDLCILKDVLQHWPLKDIYEFLDYLVENKKFKYILICNCCHQRKDDTDIEAGQMRSLSCDHLPLKKYNPTKLYNYRTKEVSVIQLI